MNNSYIKSIMLLLILMIPLMAGAEGMLGDVNNDGEVNVGDLNCVVDCILGDDFYSPNSDINGDGEINLNDINALIDIIMSDAPVDPDVMVVTYKDVSFKMIKVEGGTFAMGATEEQGEDVSNREKPVHQVTLTSYYIAQTEVTQHLWQAVMGTNPSYCTEEYGFEEDPNRPVESVSWTDCETFITRLNQLTGKNFRLPTEAEWEFAARGGNLSMHYKFSGSNEIDDVAWYYYNAGDEVGYFAPDYGTHAVATKAPNELGLYDMSGNVYEWCQDWYAKYKDVEQTDPVNTAGCYRVYRGGGWMVGASNCRVSLRSYNYPSLTLVCLGLRLAL